MDRNAEASGGYNVEANIGKLLALPLACNRRAIDAADNGLA
jgi:hypothetical protein